VDRLIGEIDQIDHQERQAFAVTLDDGKSLCRPLLAASARRIDNSDHPNDLAGWNSATAMTNTMVDAISERSPIVSSPTAWRPPGRVR
jgi:hypothetical protein